MRREVRSAKLPMTMRHGANDAMTPDRMDAARELLAFYLEAGVDALVGETPFDRLSATQIETASDGTANSAPERNPVRASALAPTAPAMRPSAGAAPAAPDVAVMAAREAAR